MHDHEHAAQAPEANPYYQLLHMFLYESRTPLSVVNGYLTLFSRTDMTNLTEEQREYLMAITHSMETVTRMYQYTVDQWHHLNDHRDTRA